MENQSQRFEYTGTIQEFIVPVSGLYQLEVWGASGGDGRIISGPGHIAIGGNGGYSCGYAYLDAGTKLYIVVGGAGVRAEIKEDGNNEGWWYVPANSPGGYNGGGDGAAFSGTWVCENGSGGGATHIALRSGLLEELSDHRDDVLIVAGGGGGGATSCYHPITTVISGGHGGGLEGGKGNVVYNDLSDDDVWNDNWENLKIATQTDGFKFGAGEDNGIEREAKKGAGGGGGWYGGIGHTGGSGYVGGVPLITYKGVVYEPSTVAGINNGNGAVVITSVKKTASTVYLGIKKILAIYYGTKDIIDIKHI